MQGAEKPRNAALRLLRWLVGLSFVDLLAFTLVVVAHAWTSFGSLVPLAEGLGALLAILAVLSILTGLSLAWRSYPQHRRALLFIVTLTLITLLAHAYVIDNPSSSAPASVSGVVGHTFNDSRVTVSGYTSGTQLYLTVTASGSSALSEVSLSGSGLLPGGGFATPPSYSEPLQPGSSVQGTWNMSSTSSVTNITVGYRYLSCYDTGDMVYGCIMDEVFYVPAAQHLLAGAQCQVGAPRDTAAYCNPEHPPLTKALMAAGMFVFGVYSVVGWRIMPVLLGTFSIPLLFGVAWKLSGSKRLAALSALLLALDVMFFSQSSGGLLDIPPVFFALAASLVLVAGLRWWKLDRYVLAGVLLGVAGLAKETAIFLAMALVTYVLLFDEGRRALRLYSSLKMLVMVGLVFAVGLQVYDSTLAASAFPTFAQHVSYMLSYGSSLIANKLACQPTTGYWCMFSNSPGGAPILPIDWLLYYSPVGYYVVSVSSAGLSWVSIGYYGVTNLIETWSVFIWVPLVAYTLYRYRLERRNTLEQYISEPISSQGMPGETRFAAFALILFLWSYVPYLFLFLGGRVTYPFYFIPAIPAVAMGASYWLTRKYFPRWLVVVYLVMAFVFFFVYFPDKSFLPNWLRALIGH